MNKPFLLFKRYKTELKARSLIGMRCLHSSGSTARLRDDLHKNQFLLGRFDLDGSHKISNGTVRTNLLGRFAQN